jgi:uncharacterized protein (TIGR02231 family)
MLNPRDRGKLRLARSVSLTERAGGYEKAVGSSLRNAIDNARVQAFSEKPLPSFQCVYEAQASANVPGDGFIHRVDMMSNGAESSVIYRTIPLADPQVFTRLKVRNPFELPLPEGEVQVFIENAYMFTTPLKGVGKNGEALFPLGVEQKLKVSRNTSFHQDERGITGGNSVAVHAIDIALRSHLPGEAKVEIIERIPVRDDNEKKIEVKLSAAEPKCEPLEFIDDHRVRGAQRWTITLEPGEEKSLRLEYQITIPSRMEIVGGNRRV